VQLVVNIDLPTDADHYVHRAGRCARGPAGIGRVISMCTSRDRFVVAKLLRQMELEAVEIVLERGEMVEMGDSRRALAAADKTDARPGAAKAAREAPKSAGAEKKPRGVQGAAGRDDRGKPGAVVARQSTIESKNAVTADARQGAEIAQGIEVAENSGAFSVDGDEPGDVSDVVPRVRKEKTRKPKTKKDVKPKKLNKKAKARLAAGTAISAAQRAAALEEAKLAKKSAAKGAPSFVGMMPAFDAPAKPSLKRPQPKRPSATARRAATSSPPPGGAGRAEEDDGSAPSKMGGPKKKELKKLNPPERAQREGWVGSR